VFIVLILSYLIILIKKMNAWERILQDRKYRPRTMHYLGLEVGALEF